MPFDRWAPTLSSAAVPAAGGADFSSDRRGAVALVFALLAVPLTGTVGLAVDYQRISAAHQFMQTQVDAAAIGSAGAGPDSVSTRWLDRVERATSAHFEGSTWPESITVVGVWTSGNEYEARAQATIDLTLLRIVPGIPDSVDINVRAVAQLALPTLIYEEPEVAQLDPEASDYNRISAYCFDPTVEGDGDGRSQMTVIADNAGTSYEFTMPRCAAGEVLSYYLKNVRGARSNPDLWDDPLRENYDYFTDTQLVEGLEQYDLEWEILETALCDTLEDCVPQGEGGVIPSGKNRVPQQATTGCEPGKYMYYGWEDRPPGRGWTDRDYDDIRVIIGCPVMEFDGDKRIRLVG